MSVNQESDTITADITFENHGSVVLIGGSTPAGQAWLDECVPVEAWQRFAGKIACEPRYVAGIVQGAQDDDLTVAFS